MKYVFRKMCCILEWKYVLNVRQLIWVFNLVEKIHQLNVIIITFFLSLIFNSTFYYYVSYLYLVCLSCQSFFFLLSSPMHMKCSIYIWLIERSFFFPLDDELMNIITSTLNSISTIIDYSKIQIFFIFHLTSLFLNTYFLIHKFIFIFFSASFVINSTSTYIRFQVVPSPPSAQVHPQTKSPSEPIWILKKWTSWWRRRRTERERSSEEESKNGEGTYGRVLQEEGRVEEASDADESAATRHAWAGHRPGGLRHLPCRRTSLQEGQNSFSPLSLFIFFSCLSLIMDYMECPISQVGLISNPLKCSRICFLFLQKGKKKNNLVFA